MNNKKYLAYVFLSYFVFTGVCFSGDEILSVVPKNAVIVISVANPNNVMNQKIVGQSPVKLPVKVLGRILETIKNSGETTGVSLSEQMLIYYDENLPNIAVIALRIKDEKSLVPSGLMKILECDSEEKIAKENFNGYNILYYPDAPKRLYAVIIENYLLLVEDKPAVERAISSYTQGNSGFAGLSEFTESRKRVKAGDISVLVNAGRLVEGNSFLIDQGKELLKIKAVEAVDKQTKITEKYQKGMLSRRWVERLIRTVITKTIRVAKAIRFIDSEITLKEGQKNVNTYVMLLAENRLGKLISDPPGQIEVINFVPEDAIMCVAGKVDHNLVRETFGGLIDAEGLKELSRGFFGDTVGKRLDSDAKAGDSLKSFNAEIWKYIDREFAGASLKGTVTVAGEEVSKTVSINKTNNGEEMIKLCRKYFTEAVDGTVYEEEYEGVKIYKASHANNEGVAHYFAVSGNLFITALDTDNGSITKTIDTINGKRKSILKSESSNFSKVISNAGEINGLLYADIKEVSSVFKKDMTEDKFKEKGIPTAVGMTLIFDKDGVKVDANLLD